jgi:hypothetical protein
MTRIAAPAPAPAGAAPARRGGRRLRAALVFRPARPAGPRAASAQRRGATEAGGGEICPSRGGLAGGGGPPSGDAAVARAPRARRPRRHGGGAVAACAAAALPGTPGSVAPMLRRAASTRIDSDVQRGGRRWRHGVPGHPLRPSGFDDSEARAGHRAALRLARFASRARRSESQGRAAFTSESPGRSVQVDLS